MRSNKFLYFILGEELKAVRKENCVGCLNDHPSQKHHSACFGISDDEDMFLSKARLQLLSRGEIERDEFEFISTNSEPETLESRVTEIIKVAAYYSDEESDLNNNNLQKSKIHTKKSTAPSQHGVDTAVYYETPSFNLFFFVIVRLETCFFFQF